MKTCIKKFTLVIVSLLAVLCFFSGDMIFADELYEITPKISVIIPVYNVERDLDTSLKTVENQTFKDIEIICVNDGSSDKSLEILEGHARRDNRIRIINQENRGISEARNVGLRASRGEYIYFCDGDDYVLPYTLEKALEKFEVYKDLDAVEFGIEVVGYNKKVNINDYKYENQECSIIEYHEGENPLQVFNPQAWGVWKSLYRKSFLIDNGLEFKKELRLDEDVCFGMLATAYMHRICRDKNIGYIYRYLRPDSLTNTICKVTKNKIESWIIISNELVAHRERFKFKGRDEHLLGIIFGSLFKRIISLKDSYERSRYAKIVCKEFGENFINKYNVYLNRSNAGALRTLRCLASNLRVRKC